MDISNAEAVLINSKISYRILSSGIEVKLGFFIGGFFIKYDRVNDELVFGSKLRWVSYAISFPICIYFLSSNLNDNTLIVTWLFLAIYSLFVAIAKERKILSIKKAACENALLTD